MNNRKDNNLKNHTELNDGQLNLLVKNHHADTEVCDTSSLKKRICEQTHLMPQIINNKPFSLVNWFKKFNVGTYLAGGASVFAAITFAIILSTNSAIIPIDKSIEALTEKLITSNWDEFYLLEEQIAYNIDIELTTDNNKTY